MFTFISFALGDWSKKILLWFMSENILSMFFFCEYYGVMSYIYKFLSHFELIFAYVWGNGLTTLIYMRLSSFPNTTCWRDCVSSIVYSCLLCWWLIDHRCAGLFLGSLFYSIDLYVCFCINVHAVFITLALKYHLKSGRIMPPALFFPPGLLWQFWVFCRFKWVLGLFVLGKISLVRLIEIALNL